MLNILPFQRPLRPALPTIIGNVDYLQFEQELRRIDELLRLSEVEASFVRMRLEAFETEAKQNGELPKVAALQNEQKHAIRALRCMILKGLLGEGYRGLSRRIAECPLFQWFCGVDELVVEVPAKSTLQRYAGMVGSEQLRNIIDTLTLAAAGGKEAAEAHPLELAKAVELDLLWMDSTCVKANIHFPVDWLLLRDAAGTLIKAIVLIRRHGLAHRMPAPQALLKQMNQLAIAMTHSRRQKDGKKARKRTFRSMKKLAGVIQRHATRYHDLLQAHWEKTDWSQAQAARVIARIGSVLEKLPEAIHQAHERIIGERQVANDKKRLSLYEENVHVIVRGKANAEVEFGNTLLISEQVDGLIVDFEFLRDKSPSDSKLLPESVKRTEALSGRVPTGLGADRGFDSKTNRELLESKGIFNGICPRNPNDLKERSSEGRFASIQRRRAQTEGRVAILKNKMLNGLLRAKGHDNRALGIAWAVLAHNLWVLARMEKRRKEQSPLQEAA